eukprot:749152-Hanusia_phi.AAC.1
MWRTGTERSVDEAVLSAGHMLDLLARLPLWKVTEPKAPAASAPLPPPPLSTSFPPSCVSHSSLPFFPLLSILPLLLLPLLLLLFQITP